MTKIAVETVTNNTLVLGGQSERIAKKLDNIKSIDSKLSVQRKQELEQKDISLKQQCYFYSFVRLVMDLYDIRNYNLALQFLRELEYNEIMMLDAKLSKQNYKKVTTLRKICGILTTGFVVLGFFVYPLLFVALFFLIFLMGSYLDSDVSELVRSKKYLKKKLGDNYFPYHLLQENNTQKET